METLISGLGKREGKGLERRKIKKWFSPRVGNVSEQQKSVQNIQTCLCPLYSVFSILVLDVRGGDEGVSKDVLEKLAKASFQV